MPVGMVNQPYDTVQKNTRCTQQSMLREATCCQFRDWCAERIAGKSVDPRQPLATETTDYIIPTIELDNAAASGETSVPESKFPILTAAE